MFLYAITIFLSAFLLFQVQPLIAKIILPWFGGSAAVWSAAMMFFQISLLAGYAYAHFLGKAKARTQMMVHGSLLVLSCLLLPILPSATWKPTAVGDPTIRIVELLAATIGLPYFLLSSTSPLLQMWYVRKTGSGVPYKLFALSNFGSMLALLSFPFIVEPQLTSKWQAYSWSGLYIAFALLCIVAALASQQEHVPAVAANDPAVASAAVVADTQSVPPTLGQKTLWVSLAACASVLLVSVTNHMSANVAPIPLLWVIPLALYLLSFILSFESDRIYQRWLFVPWVVPALAWMAYSIYAAEGNYHIKIAIPVYSLGLFFCCMFCHGELAKRKPAPRYLTSFYLMISLGGALGGIFVALIAPNVFKSFLELPIGLTACGILVVLCLWDEEMPRMTVAGRAGLGVVLALAPAALLWYLGRPQFEMIATAVVVVALLVLLWMDKLHGKWPVQAASAIGVGLLVGYLGGHEREDRAGYHLMVRNFYGALRVRDDDAGTEFGIRNLLHGTINHGSQRLSEPDRYRVGSYYSPTSGIGLVMKGVQARGPIRYGVVGLGAGVMTGYSRKGDYVRVYEINPIVPTLSARQNVGEGEFSFFPHSEADKAVLMGDARLTMEAQEPPNYDVLVIDAFSSDAIPVHLLTRESFLLYKRMLKPNGVLAVHISNRYLDLAPVCARGAEAMGWNPMVVYDATTDTFTNSTTWVLITADKSFFDLPSFQGANIYPPMVDPKFRAWTDDYSNIVSILSLN